MLILVASMLPALHALEHPYLDSDIALEITEGSSDRLTPSNVDCSLCDFQFSSSNVPVLFEHSLNSPEIQTNAVIFSEQYSPLFFSPYFSLRAPPVAFI